jgi:predicted GTPase
MFNSSVSNAEENSQEPKVALRRTLDSATAIIVVEAVPMKLRRKGQPLGMKQIEVSDYDVTRG